MSAIANTLFVEKYRPRTLEDYVCSSEQKESFQKFIESKDIPHLLLHGVAGTGKTSLAKIFAREVSGDNFLYINASDENGIDSIRELVVSFASSVSESGIKIVILDEADFLTPQAQSALRNVMETFSAGTRFILTCNYIDRIIDPLLSRMQQFHIEPLDTKDVMRLVVSICKKESIKFEKDSVISLVEKTYPDIRRTLNGLQQYSLSGNLIIPTTLNGSSAVSHIVDMIENGDVFQMIRQELLNANIRDYNILFKAVYDRVLSCDESTRFGKHSAEVILIIAEAQYKDAFVVDHEINAMAMVIRIIDVVHKGLPF